MLVFRNSLLVVVIVVVVWVRRSICEKNDIHPIPKRFHIFGCTQNNITKELIRVKQFGKRYGIYIGLSGTSTNTTVLRSNSSLTCKLPTDILFFTSSTSEGGFITITFHRVPENNTKPYGRLETVTGKQVDENVDELLPGSNMEGHARPNNVTGVEGEGSVEDSKCTVNINDQFKLDFGYGFIACADDPADINKLWREWQESVIEDMEAKEQFKNTIILAATCGPGSLVLFIILCALCRLRFSSSDQNLSRRPSTTSGVRTGSTH